MKFTSLARPIDLTYKTNLIIVLLTLAMSAIHSLSAGFTIFLSWAIAREVNYKNEIISFVPVFVSMYIIYLYGPANNLVLFGILLLFRLFSNTNTTEVLKTDYFIVFAFCAIAMFTISNNILATSFVVVTTIATTYPYQKFIK